MLVILEKVLQLQEVGRHGQEDESALIGGPGLLPSQKEPVCLPSVPLTLRCVLTSGGLVKLWIQIQLV